MITEDYVSFEVAKLLKKKNFSAPCRAAYTSHGSLQDMLIKEVLTNGTCPDTYWECVAPTIQMAMKWLREVHHLTIIISPQWAEGDMRNTCTWRWEIRGLEDITSDIYDNRLFGFTYEEAVEIAIRYALNHLI